MRLDVCGRHPLLQRGPVLEDDGLSALTIDMSGMSFASPLDLSAVAAISEQAVRRGVPVTVRRSEHPGVDAYVERMDLYRHLDPAVRVDRPRDAGVRSPLSHVLVEVSPVRDTDAASDVGERFAQVATEQHFGPAVPGLFRALGELLDNAATHGASETGAFAAAQFYTGETSGRRGFELAVCDTGIGVREHLSRQHKRVTTDKLALEQAPLAGISGTGEPDRGYGLHDVVQYVGHRADAAFVIASGDTAVYTSQRDGRLKNVFTPMHNPIEGTWVWLRVRLPICD